MPATNESLVAEEQALKVEKLKTEIAHLKQSQSGVARIKEWLPLLTAAIPALALAFAALQYTTKQRDEHDQLIRKAKSDSLAAERAFLTPILERQMTLYMSAIDAAATIAGSQDATEKRKAADTFWTLYYGPLAMFESQTVINAMVDFGNCLKAAPQCTTDDTRNKSLRLASALQQDYFASWNLSPVAYAKRSTDYLKRQDSLNTAPAQR